jgi:hypothetical protein
MINIDKWIKGAYIYDPEQYCVGIITDVSKKCNTITVDCSDRDRVRYYCFSVEVSKRLRIISEREFIDYLKFNYKHIKNDFKGLVK